MTAHANLCHEQRILSQGEQTLSLDGTVKTMEQREGEISALMDTVSGKLKKMHALFTDMCECVVKIQDLRKENKEELQSSLLSLVRRFHSRPPAW